MKLLNAPKCELLYRETDIVIAVDNEYRKEVIELLHSVDWKGKDTHYTVKIEPLKEKRTKDQNAYAWEFIGRLAKVMRLSSNEVYRELMRDMPTYEIIPIKNEAVKRFTKAWNRNGIGWICEDMRESKIPGYRNIKCHYGSSTFTKEEMSQFIDLIIEECKNQGVPTAELESAKSINCFKGV